MKPLLSVTVTRQQDTGLLIVLAFPNGEKIEYSNLVAENIQSAAILCGKTIREYVFEKFQSAPDNIYLKCDPPEYCIRNSPGLVVPAIMYDSNHKIKECYWHQDFHGFYVSPCGQVYCCRKCWVVNCE